MSDGPTVTRLPSGYTLIRWSRECLAQIPPGFAGEYIPDHMMTSAAWNRERVNRWWTQRRRADALGKEPT